MSATHADGPTNGRPPRHAFGIGVAAVVIMAAVLAVLRYTTGTPSLPELFGEAIIGLLPPPVFSALIDALQRAAKPLLYTGVGAGMLLVGGLLGQGFAFGPATWGRAVRLAAVLWAIFGLVVLPLMGGGLFGGSGLRTGVVALAIQQALAFGSFAAALVLLLRATDRTQAAPVLSQRRRAAVMAVTSGLALVALGGTAWRALLGSSRPVSDGVSTNTPADAGRAAGTTSQDSMDASQAAAPSPVAASASPDAGPARGLPRLDAPPVPMTVRANQPAPAPFDVPKLTPEVLTAKEFYTVSKNLIDPVVDGQSWSLRVDGLVERPATYTYADVTALPTHSDYYTLLCISNSVGGDLWGNAHWRGVRLVEILSRAGLKAGVRKVVFHAEDGYTDSVTLDAALRPDTLLAYEMNGEVLPKEHGYPARLLIPGIYGMKNVKWITRIELVDYDFKGYWMQRGWDDVAAYRTSTRIDVPAGRAQMPPGEIALAGVTFAGFRGVTAVEVSLDDGKTWEAGTLKPALGLNAWNLWVYRKSIAPGAHTVKVRAVDGNGDVQTATENDPLPSGATGYHSVSLRIG